MDHLNLIDLPDVLGLRRLQRGGRSNRRRRGRAETEADRLEFLYASLLREVTPAALNDDKDDKEEEEEEEKCIGYHELLRDAIAHHMDDHFEHEKRGGGEERYRGVNQDGAATQQQPLTNHGRRFSSSSECGAARGRYDNVVGRRVEVEFERDEYDNYDGTAGGDDDDGEEGEDGWMETIAVVDGTTNDAAVVAPSPPSTSPSHLSYHNRQPSSSSSHYATEERRRRQRQQRETAIESAWRLLSSFPSPDKEGSIPMAALNGDCEYARNDVAAAALRYARDKEERVVELIREIGEVMARAEKRDGRRPGAAKAWGQSLRGPAVDDENEDEERHAAFAYFCEKNVLALLVDVAKAAPPPRSAASVGGSGLDVGGPAAAILKEEAQQFDGVTWTASVKSQVVQTVSMMVTYASSPTSLFYLLSNDHVNDLVDAMIPVPERWTDVALDETMPVYATFLKSLALRLSGGPNTKDDKEQGRRCDLAPFFLRRGGGGGGGGGGNDSANGTTFPLLQAAVGVATSPYARLDSFVRLTALNVVLNVCRSTDPDVRTAVAGSNGSRDALIGHLCRNLASSLRRIGRLVSSSSSSVGSTARGMPMAGRDNNNDRARFDATEAEVGAVHDRLHFLNDFLRCGVRPWNVRLCEDLMRDVVVGVALRSWFRCDGGVVGGEGSSVRRNGGGDSRCSGNDTLSEEEGAAHASVWFLSQLFLTVDYPPLLRMVAVAVLHPFSPAAWHAGAEVDDGGEYAQSSAGVDCGGNGGEFVVTPLLNDIAQHTETIVVVGESLSSSVPLSPLSSTREGDTSLSQDQTSKGVVMSGEATCEVDGGNNSNTVSGREDDTEQGGSPTPSSAAVLVVPNPYRAALLRLLRGDVGEQRFVAASMLLQGVLESDSLDDSVLERLEVLPRFSSRNNSDRVGFSEAAGDGDAVEAAIATFLPREGRPPSSSSVLAMECAGSLGLSILSRLVQRWTEGGAVFETFDQRYHYSPLVRSFWRSRALYAAEALQLRRKSASVSEIFVDLVEMEINRRYSTITNGDGTKSYSSTKKPRTFMTCSLGKFRPANLWDRTEVLTKKVRDVGANDVERARFAIRMTLHMNALCKVLQDLHERLGSIVGPRSIAHQRWHDNGVLSFRALDEADDDLMAISGVKDRADVGTDLDLHGRTFFYFCPSLNVIDPRFRPRGALGAEFDRGVKLAEDLLTLTSTQAELVLVLDPTEMFVVKPNKKNYNRGTILCSAPLRCIITAAVDGVWLHVAIRQKEDVGVLIKNGNMALRFDSNGTCLIVRQYLERCRMLLQAKLLEQVESYLDRCTQVDLLAPHSLSVPNGQDDQESLSETQNAHEASTDVSQSERGQSGGSAKVVQV